MTPIEQVLAKLPEATSSGDGWAAHCPAHVDRQPSLSISTAGDGKVLLKCHAGCPTEEVVAALDLTLAELFPRAANHQWSGAKEKGPACETAGEVVAYLESKLGKATQKWRYRDATGEVVGLVVRWTRSDGTKDIRPVSRLADCWRAAAMPPPRPLYNLPDLAAAERVVVCEGEKAADSATALGFVATTSAGGASSAAQTDWSPLAGKTVWILPDNDEPGRKYAAAVASTVQALTPPSVVKIVEIPDLPDKRDLANWVSARIAERPVAPADEPAIYKAMIEELAARVEPEPAPAGDEPYRPFPVEALPEPVATLVRRAATAIGCDPAYVALPLLSGLAAADGTSRQIELKPGWAAPAIVWTVVVGESGTQKTPAFQLALRPFRARETRAMVRHAAATKAHDAELARRPAAAGRGRKTAASESPIGKPPAPACERFVVGDTTVEALAPILLDNPRGLLVARDELATWFGSFDRYAGKRPAGSDAANWLSMFNAEAVTVDRKTGTPRTIHVPRAAACVTGGIQPGVFRRALGEEHRESGLAARFLVCWPPRRVRLWTEAEIDPAAVVAVDRVVDRLYDLKAATGDDGEPCPHSVRLSPDAKARYVAYYESHAVEHNELTGDLASAWSKLEEYAARLALVVHCTRWAADDSSLADPETLDGASMAAGICLAAWFKNETRRVYALLTETEIACARRQLFEWFQRRKDPATAREVQQGCRWLKTAADAEAALEDLARSGAGLWEEVVPTEKGGRRTRRFRLTRSI